MTYIIVASKKQLGSQYFTKLNLQHMCIVFLVTNFFPRSDDEHVNRQKYEKDDIRVSFFNHFQDYTHIKFEHKPNLQSNELNDYG